MNTNYYAQRVRPLKALYDKLESICTRHVGISSFDSGDLLDNNSNSLGSHEYTFPMAYLETISSHQENEIKSRITYSIALNILDRQPDGSSRSELINVHDKLMQLFAELKGFMELKSQFGDKNISPASVVIFNDFDDDKLVRLRGEFIITTDALLTDPSDFASLFPEL